ncbi:MAG: radical SAM family heme chaperone HemW [Oscillospiraceae bacterium]|nr:radical SAM family heme chaperone HemW [Oscillospiraceae bacterium]
MKKPDKPLGLYIHIPFCKSKCVYCDFYSLPNAEREMNRYTSAVCRHLTETAPQAAAHLADTIYFGGGTPSYLGPRRLQKILKTVRKHYRIAPDAEVTLEANPDSIGDWRKLRALRKAGVNRISLGVQSADDKELQALGRPHTYAQAVDAVGAVRRAGIRNLSLDLIYGLPGQTLALWQRTLNRAAALEPEHLSCYGLKVEEGTPLWDRREGLDLPGDDAQADMYLWTVERLAALGYAQYEISNFAKPGFASRHNMKYWTLGEYAGFGPGAHSDLGDVRYAYVRDLDAYCRGIKSGGSILAESERIPPRERDLEYLMLGLRTTQGIAQREFENRFRLSFAPIEEELKKFLSSGHAVQSGGRWHLTPEGFLVSNQIIGRVLDALGQEKLRRLQAAASGDYRIVQS